MSYFFTHFLQTFLPFSLLLTSLWAKQKTLPVGRLTWLTLLAGLMDYGLSFLPNQQIMLLTRNLLIVLCLVLFALSQRIISPWLSTIWHSLLLAIAFLLWFDDPNLAAISQLEALNSDVILYLFAIITAALFTLSCVIWFYNLLKERKTFQKTTALLPKLVYPIAVSLLIAALLLPWLGELVLNLIKLQLLDLSKNSLTFVAKTSSLPNHYNYISTLVIFISLVPLALHYLNLKAQSKSIDAEADIINQRQAQGKIQQRRRLMLSGVLMGLILFASQYYWDKVASQPPKLSEAKAVYLSADNQIHIPISQVSDGKLHRFIWVSDEGKGVRFFVLNRQADRLSLAVVFDACLLCGEKGYVMQGNQVICIGCGVYMFTPSIGKAGGCNPVPIEDWQQQGQEILISKKSLEAGLMLFSTKFDPPKAKE